MRQIKFRAWDKENKKMHKVNMIDFIEGEIFVEPQPKNKSRLWFEECKDSILMQYTGLKDKNGEEIYEGDIIKKEWDDEIEEVTWNEGYVEPFNFSYYEDPEGGEILGNIYENPELLDK